MIIIVELNQRLFVCFFFFFYYTTTSFILFISPSLNTLYSGLYYYTVLDIRDPPGGWDTHAVIIMYGLRRKIFIADFEDVQVMYTYSIHTYLLCQKLGKVNEKQKHNKNNYKNKTNKKNLSANDSKIINTKYR